MWSGGKKPWDQLREDALYTMPQILAKKAVYKTKEYDIHGFLFCWWKKPDNVETLIEEVRALIAPRTFDILYTADILEECIREQYPWYLRIIRKEEKRINELFNDLYGHDDIKEDNSETTKRCSSN